MLRHLLASALLLSFAFLGWACGHPGGSVGDSCTIIGSSEECEDDFICDEIDGTGSASFCVRICNFDDDCDIEEECNDVARSDLLGCSPIDP